MLDVEASDTIGNVKTKIQRTNTMHNMNTVAHMDVHNTQY